MALQMIAGEHFLARARQHWFLLVPRFTALAVGSVLALVVVTAIPDMGAGLSFRGAKTILRLLLGLGAVAGGLV